MRNASDQQGENERQLKKKEIKKKFSCEHIRHSLHETCNWEVKRCCRATTTTKKCRRKYAARAKLLFC